MKERNNFYSCNFFILYTQYIKHTLSKIIILSISSKQNWVNNISFSSSVLFTSNICALCFWFQCKKFESRPIKWQPGVLNNASSHLLGALISLELTFSSQDSKYSVFLIILIKSYLKGIFNIQKFRIQLSLIMFMFLQIIKKSLHN